VKWTLEESPLNRLLLECAPGANGGFASEFTVGTNLEQFTGLEFVLQMTSPVSNLMPPLSPCDRWMMARLPPWLCLAR
jgi:hypothetical protein